jgi:hypothetical protein
VLRKRLTAGGKWVGERWSREALMWEADDESDIPF